MANKTVPQLATQSGIGDTDLIPIYDPEEVSDEKLKHISGADLKADLANEYASSSHDHDSDYDTLGAASSSMSDHESANDHDKLHDRMHNMTGTAEHNANPNLMFYSANDGTIGAIAHGTNDYILTSTGATSAPSWQSTDKFLRSDQSDTMDGDLSLEGLEITRSGGDAYIDFKSIDSEDYDCRFIQSSDGIRINTGGDGSTLTGLIVDSDQNVKVPNGSLYVEDGGLYSHSDGTGNVVIDKSSDSVYSAINFTVDEKTNWLLLTADDSSGDLILQSKNYDTDGGYKDTIFNIDWGTGQSTFYNDLVVDATLTLDNGTSINEFSTDTTLSGNSDDIVSTEKAVKTYIDNKVEIDNYLINGSFDIWQRGTSQTSSDYGSDDRWRNIHSAATKTHTRQSFTLGQTDVPGNPEFYSRTVVTTASNSSEYVIKRQYVEDVHTLSGETVTVSFYAKADASKNIAIEFEQTFGSGGSPSSGITEIGSQKVALTTSWERHTVTVDIPSISGKTLGTDNNSSLILNFWYTAGSTYNSRTDSLGTQSGTFELSNVKLEKGSVATPFVVRPLQQEQALCDRYFVRLNFGSGNSCASYGYALNTTLFRFYLPLPCNMRGTPTVTGIGTYVGNGGSVSSSSPAVVNTNPNGLEMSDTVSGLSTSHCYVVRPSGSSITVDAEL